MRDRGEENWALVASFPEELDQAPKETEESAKA
jgi:hypothetical protein